MAKRPRAWVAAAAALLPCICALAQQHPQARQLIHNGNFDKNIDGWSLWFAPGQAEGSARWQRREAGGAMHVIVTRRDNPSAVQIFQGPFPVRKGAWYEVVFEARADKQCTLRLALMRNSPPWGSFGLNSTVTLGPQWTTFSFLVRATDDSDDARIDFFPDASFWLDAVSVTQLPAGPPTARPVAVVLGRGWRGKPAALIDDNPRTFVSTRYYPVLPVFITLDLGKLQPVGAVIIQAEDRGRHTYVREVQIDVSADGQKWLQWATAIKSAKGTPSARRAVEFFASGLAAPVRYVRLRISKLRGAAWLSEARVSLASRASTTALHRLEPRPAAADVAFVGWDYHSLGYALSPGERPSLRFANQADISIDVPVQWRLETYAGDRVTDGNDRLRIPPLSTSEVPLEIPSQLRDGPYRLRFSLGHADEQACYFDFRRAQNHPAFGLRLVALMDNLDPEGWVRLMAGPLAPYIDVRRAIPADPSQVDAVLVMAENWPPDKKEVSSLGDYLRAGGKAVMYGKIARSLEPMLPVHIDYERPWAPAPVRLAKPSFWPSFDRAKCPRHYSVKVAPRQGSTILARWSDGSPAVVEGRYGAGRVVYIAAAPGRLWQMRTAAPLFDELTFRTLYYLTGRSEALNALDKLINNLAMSAGRERRAAIGTVAPDAPPTARTGLSSGNFGRFGWLVAEGGLVDNISASAELRSPATSAVWRLSVPGRGPLHGRPERLNWLAKTIRWSDDKGTVFRSTISLASAAILWEGSAHSIELLGPATHALLPTAAGPQSLAPGDQASGSSMSSGWILLIDGRKEVRDVPLLVLLKRKPDRVAMGANRLQLTFSGPEGFQTLWTGRLYGIRRFAPGQTGQWVKRPPDDLDRRVQDIARLWLAFPIACQEVYWRDGEAIVVADRFQFRTFSDDWGTQAKEAAPLPPILSLARRHGIAIRIFGRVTDTGIATKYGPLEVVSGDRVRYALPMPPTDHFAAIPVRGKMDLADAIDHYALDGIASVKRASGGLTTSSPFLADLRDYMASGSVPPWEAACIDVYKWWYCFPTVLGRPAYSQQTRHQVDAHYRQHYWQTLNFYPHKTLIRYRREPWTRLDYALTFIWPVFMQDGVRFFVDENEAAAVVLYCLWSYAQYYGDWTTLESNWTVCRHFHSYLRRVHDWALMASSNQEFYATVGIDMLNSEYPGNLAFARMARQVGDEEAEDLGLYLAAKAAIPTVARHFMPDWIAEITTEGDPWRKWRYFWSLHEGPLAGSETMIMRGGTEPILALAIGFLDTSKGTSPEVALLYKQFVPQRMRAYEEDIDKFGAAHGRAPGWAHLMQRAFLGWPRESLIGAANRFNAERPRWGWQSTKAAANMAVACTTDTPLFLADWAPAGYVAGSFDPRARTLSLTFDAADDDHFAVRLYSRWPPLQVALDGAPCKNWSYDSKTGWLSATLPGGGFRTLKLTLSDAAVAPPHPYLPR